MRLIDEVGNHARRANAIVRERCFSESGAPGRLCCVDLRSMPRSALTIRIDQLVRRSPMVKSSAIDTCECEHRTDVVGKGHQICDYAIVSDGGLPLVVLVEVKSGWSDKQRDIKTGLSQVVCSRSVFLKVLDGCSSHERDIPIVGVVVSPAASVAEDTDRLLVKWSRQFRMRLIQTHCGSDLWSAAIGGST